MMKKFRFPITLAIGMLLLTTAMVSLTGCNTKYRPIHVTVEDGYAISWGQDPFGIFPSLPVFSVKDTDGDVIAIVQTGSTVEDGKLLGIREDENRIGLTIYLNTEYDFDSITVSINDKPLTRTNPPSADTKANSLVSLGFNREASSDETSFNIKIGGFKAMTIGGHKWKLYALKDKQSGETYRYADQYNEQYVGSQLNYKFDFKRDGSASMVGTDNGVDYTREGTWTEENGALTAIFGTDTVNMAFMTQADSNSLITADDIMTIRSCILWDTRDIEVILVLDIDM